MPVEFTTSFSCTEKGTCRLTLAELAAAFGLPSYLSGSAQREAFPFPHVQLLDALLRPSLHHLITPVSTSPAMLCVPTTHPPKYTYFPQLRKYLSNFWASIHARMTPQIKPLKLTMHPQFFVIGKTAWLAFFPGRGINHSSSAAFNVFDQMAFLSRISSFFRLHIWSPMVTPSRSSH